VRGAAASVAEARLENLADARQVANMMPDQALGTWIRSRASVHELAAETGARARQPARRSRASHRASTLLMTHAVVDRMNIHSPRGGRTAATRKLLLVDLETTQENE